MGEFFQLADAELTGFSTLFPISTHCGKQIDEAPDKKWERGIGGVDPN